MIKQALCLLIVVGLTGFAIGENTGAGNSGGSADNIAIIGSTHNQINQPVWTKLIQMDLNQRFNSNIEVEISSRANEAALNLANEIELMWNSGGYENAIAGFSQLRTLVGNSGIAIGVQWKTPVNTDNDNSAILWERDIRVNNQDSIYGATLNSHLTSGNLFGVLLIQDGPFQMFSINHSADSGHTWAETFYWVSPDIVPSVGSAIMGNRCYIAYPLYNSLRLKCFDVIDGHLREFVDSTATVHICSIGANDTLKEISLVSNLNANDNRLYCTAITNQGQLVYYWADRDAVSWNPVLTGIGNADRGLDVSFNEQFGEYYLLVSYIDRADKLNIFGRRNQIGPDQDEAGNLGR
jgi:hypothetical protein